MFLKHLQQRLASWLDHAISSLPACWRSQTPLHFEASVWTMELLHGYDLSRQTETAVVACDE
ncbi:MAG: hypothetical protein Tsb002_33640 [Wenzhouxiangellaceae bacterium]